MRSGRKGSVVRRRQRSPQEEYSPFDSDSGKERRYSDARKEWEEDGEARGTEAAFEITHVRPPVRYIRETPDR